MVPEPYESGTNENYVQMTYEHRGKNSKHTGRPNPAASTKHNTSGQEPEEGSSGKCNSDLAPEPEAGGGGSC